MNKNVEGAVKVLKNGGIVIAPTDTTFIITCAVNNKEAIKRLFNIRRRPKTQAVSLLVDTIKMAQEYLLPIPKEVIDKFEPYWPGALTLILDCNRVKVPELVRGGGKTLGVRIPNHAVARAIIRGVGVPILGPSANFHGEETPYKFEDLNQELVKLVDYVLPGTTNSLSQPSTVIDCSVTPWRIIREGALRLRSGQANYEYVLLIDTTDSKQICVGLRVDGKEYFSKQKTDYRKAQVVLPLIDEILRKKKLNLKDLSAIEVNIGEGSFTGVRVGLSVVNALGFALKIPVKKMIY